MGRSARKILTKTEPRSPYRLVTSSGATHQKVGSPAHRERLTRFARQRIRSVKGRMRGEVRVLFENFCQHCNHRLQDHLQSHICQGKIRNKTSGQERACDCGKYKPGGQSRTNMKGRIIVQSDVPSDGEAWERRICIDGLLRHELCHELYTDPEDYQKFRNYIAKLRKDGDFYSDQLHGIFNIVEDGRIETVEMNEQEGSYAYIEALNLLHPRVSYPEDDKPEPLPANAQWQVPPGYTALDAHGNVLDQVEVVQDPLTGEEKYILHVPRGTELRTWGPKPVSLPWQMQAALLAESVPGFEVGEVHPEVARVLDLCQLHIQSATIYGSSCANATSQAIAIYNILRENDMLLQPNERQQGGYPGGDPSDGEVDNPDGPVPDPPEPPVGGDDEGEGDGGNKGDGEDEGGSGDGEDEGDDGDEGGSGDGEDEGDDGDEGEGKGDKHTKGGKDPSEESGYNPDAELPETAVDRQKRREELQKLREEAEADIQEDEKRDRQSEQKRRSNKDYRAEDFETPRGEQVHSQTKMVEKLNGREALSGDRSDIKSLGNKLARQLEEMRVTHAEPRRYKRRGQIDRRRLHAVPTGDSRVMQTRGKTTELDLEVAVVIDRSMSVSAEAEETESQFRMALMCGHAGNATGVPIGIYGYSGTGYSGAEHYAFKEARSEDLRGIDAIFQSGGGNTPTAEGVAFAAARLQQASSQDRVMVVVTDGQPSNQEAAQEQVRVARQQGIRVVGVGFMGAGLQSGGMDETFGKDSWHAIDDYEDAPKIVAGLIQDTVGSRLG